MSTFAGTVGGFFGKVVLKLQDKSPELSIGGGIILGIVAGVTACKASAEKAAEIAAEHEARINTIEAAVEAVNNGETDKEFSAKDRALAVADAYRMTAIKVVKVYGKSILLAIISIILILNGARIFRGRNAALSVGLAAAENLIRTYRGNVVERFGEEVDKELLFGVKHEEIEETTTLKNGKEKVVKKDVLVVDNPLPSQYARFFDETSDYYIYDDPNNEHNLTFLRQKEAEWNKIFEIRAKHNRPVLLNEVYKDLGFQMGKIGSRAGWSANSPYLDKNHPISFGIYNLASKANRSFVNGYEPVILLDFNVTGDVFNELPN